MQHPQTPPELNELLNSPDLDLGELFSSELYRSFTRRCEASYWHWDKLRFIARSKGLDPEWAWAMVKLGRLHNYRSLPLAGHNGVTLRYTLPDAMQRELMLIDQQLAGRLTADIERPLSTAHRERFVISALQDEAIASSMLEGAATTRNDAKQMLRSGRKPRNTGEKMVINNYQTILFIRDTKNVDLSPEYLLEIQRMLTHDTLEHSEHVGRFRTEDDDIRIVDERDEEVMHVPPPAKELTSRLKSLCKFANASDTSDKFIHPVIRACILHFQIGFDHPFCDGNGRTARAIFYWYLLRSDYWLFEFLPISPMFYESPAKYARAYLHTETDEFDVTYFLTYNLKIIARGRMDFIRYLLRKQDQLAQARRLFKSDPLLNHRQYEILLKVARNPDIILRIADHQNTHRIAYGTARTDLLGLERHGYLSRARAGNAYVFTQGPKLDALDLTLAGD